MQVIINIGNFIWNLIEKIADTIDTVIEFIGNIIGWITSYLAILPSSIQSILLMGLGILIALLIYRFIR